MSTLQERLRANPLTLSAVLPLCAEAAARIDADAERIRELESAVHSCHPGCTLSGCVNDRLRESIEEQRRTIVSLMCGMPDDGTTPVIRRIAALEAALKVAQEELSKAKEREYNPFEPGNQSEHYKRLRAALRVIEEVRDAKP